MKFQRPYFSTRLRAGWISLLLIVPALSQEVALEALVEGSKTAIQAENWEQALDFNNRAVAAYGQNHPLAHYGPQFGAVFFHKGLCEMKLKRWQDAMRSFETCYRDFPNPRPAKANANPFEKRALLKWAESAMGAEQWLLALNLFSKFTVERDRTRDTHPLGAFYVNSAICHYRLGHIPQGNENLEIAISNRAGFPTPDTGIVAGFQALVTAAIVQHDEQVLLDFIGKNRSALIIHPQVMHGYSRAFLQLAGDARDAGMMRAALVLYPLVPGTDEAIDDVRARLKSLGPAAELQDGRVLLSRADLERELAELEAERRGKQPLESIKLAGIALIHEAAGNLPGALAAYRQLETFYPNAEKREDYLFNLVRLSAVAGLAHETPDFARTFAAVFPDSPRLAEVRRLWISSLFANGDHAACIAAVESLAGSLRKGAPEDDFCTYILGASLFQTGLHEKAQAVLDAHAATYPTGEWALPTAFFQASNLVRLGAMDRAAPLLDRFLAAHPQPADNPFLAAALHERAICHASAGQTQAALKIIDRILISFPSSPVADSAHELKGRLELASGNGAGAEKAFLKALENAVASGDRATAGEVLTTLVEILAGNAKRSKDALKHADRFWKDFAKDSPYRNRMAIAEVSAFTAAGRADDALARLRAAIVETSKTPDSTELRPLIDAYTAAYLSRHRAEELAADFEKFPGIDPTNKPARAALRIAVIGTYEALAESAPDESRRQAAGTAVRELFQKFKIDFTLKDLADRELLRLGDFLHFKTSTPREALGYYDEVIARDDPAMRFAARLGRGDVLSKSATVADIDASLADFRTVWNDSKRPDERDYAMLRWFQLAWNHSPATRDATCTAGASYLAQTPAVGEKDPATARHALEELVRTSRETLKTPPPVR